MQRQPPPAAGLEVRGLGETLDWARPANDVTRIFREVAEEVLRRAVPGSPNRPAWLDDFLARAGVSDAAWAEAGIRLQEFLVRLHDAADDLPLAEAAAGTIDRADPAARLALYAVIGQVFVVATHQAFRRFPTAGGLYVPRAKADPAALVASALRESGAAVGLGGPAREGTS